MQKNFSLIVSAQDGSFHKEISISKTRLVTGIMALLVFLLIIAAVICDSVFLKRNNGDLQELKNQMDLQAAEIKQQFKKIEIFNNDIKTLRDNLLKLKNYEARIRGIAGIEKTDDSTGHLVGIGGAASADHPYDSTGDKNARMPMSNKR